VYKDEATDILIHAIRKVHCGEAWLGRALTAAVLARLSRSQAPPAAPRDPESIKISSLTRREREIVGLIATGSNRKTTAEKLFISEATVRNHLTSILAKLNLTSKFDLVFYAQRHGLIENALVAEKVES
jgi:DNA-binding NarL/FixJ family response regulator